MFKMIMFFSIHTHTKGGLLCETEWVESPPLSLTWSITLWNSTTVTDFRIHLLQWIASTFGQQLANDLTL